MKPNVEALALPRGGQLLNPCPLQTKDTSHDKIPESSFSPVNSEITACDTQLQEKRTRLSC